MAYKYTREEWQEIQRIRQEEDREQARAYAEDMDVWSALREEQHLAATHSFEFLREKKGL
jgi:hypothetical protein